MRSTSFETLICGQKLGKDTPISFAKKYYIFLNFNYLTDGHKRAISMPIRRGKEHWGDHGVIWKARTKE
jgi:hypothetical protein